MIPSVLDQGISDKFLALRLFDLSVVSGIGTLTVVPMPSKIDYSEAEQFLRQGKTRAEVAAVFDVTPAAIGVAIMRGNIRVDYQRPKQRLPWKVRPEHQRLAIPSMLRYAMRLADGEEKYIPEKMLPDARAFLRELEARNLVIHYEPDAAPYWFRVPRRPGIDTGLVREPAVETKD